jgi:hypothetical protein
VFTDFLQNQSVRGSFRCALKQTFLHIRKHTKMSIEFWLLFYFFSFTNLLWTFITFLIILLCTVPWCMHSMYLVLFLRKQACGGENIKIMVDFFAAKLKLWTFRRTFSSPLSLSNWIPALTNLIDILWIVREGSGREYQANAFIVVKARKRMHVRKRNSFVFWCSECSQSRHRWGWEKKRKTIHTRKFSVDPSTFKSFELFASF